MRLETARTAIISLCKVVIESPARYYDFVGGQPKTRFLPQDIQERKGKYNAGPGPKQLNLFDNVTIRHK